MNFEKSITLFSLFLIQFLQSFPLSLYSLPIFSSCNTASILYSVVYEADDWIRVFSSMSQKASHLFKICFVLFFDCIWKKTRKILVYICLSFSFIHKCVQKKNNNIEPNEQNIVIFSFYASSYNNIMIIFILLIIIIMIVRWQISV